MDRIIHGTGASRRFMFASATLESQVSFVDVSHKWVCDVAEEL